ncbi:MAG TPA: PQQ-binding-like beta-propeller repeat protein [Gemmataceae bacterium]|nr:PQQ-binding-like beta-propeller repeat protein [Gemmataceae bacterium]
MPYLRSTLILLACTACAAAADWPQWLGPRRDGSSPEKVAPWKEPPKALWRAPVGEGHSSPVVAAGKVFLHTKVKDRDAEEVAAYDAATGKELWKKSYPRAKFTSVFGTGPQATPAYADGKLYTFGVTGLLTCWDADKGDRLWQLDTQKDFKPAKRFPADFGVACSPLVEGGHVLVNVGGKGASVVAFNRKDGKVAWKKLDDKASYSSPIAFGQGKGRQVVFLTAAGLASFRPSDGEVLWQFPLADKLMESSSTPLKVGDLILAGSITYGSAGVKLEAKDGKPAVKEAWKNPALTCYFSSPVAVSKDHVFIITNTNPLLEKPQATLRCVEARTGKELWKKPAVGKYHAALIRTGDGKVLLLDDASNLILLDPSSKEYRELAKSKVCGETWAHPALAGGRLYLRDNQELICLQLGE